jgi:hypothetical protein
LRGRGIKAALKMENKESVSKLSQLKAMIVRNVTLKRRSGRKTVAVSISFLSGFIVLNETLAPATVGP